MRKIMVISMFLITLLLSGCTNIAPTEKISINFETNGGKQLATLVYEGELEDITLPVTLRDGFEFVGWYTDRRLTIPLDLSILSGVDEITLYAKWHELVVDPDKITT